MTKEKIFEFFKAKGVSDNLDFETDLFKGGFIDSLFAFEVVVFLEETFGVHLDNKDITEENFRTITSMASMIDRIRGV
ncbi:MAG TPA: phosphopantetheine-binding protein [Bacillota bacterium]|nr:phosphopantetheine-binding protein [Bacillota bacterium]HOL12406.1 phosphopantetheine-binding protein [Bacillota bacterium]HPP61359.1 phosphopantetheine-binding protein [Bacillota bacterium]HQE49248.1 phosphopantetheine-binding protein [Fervidobacterium sp.]